MSAIASTSELVEFRQLRHQTKNVLARILAQVSAGMPASEPLRRVAADVEHRVLLTAQISDALFGLTRAPGPFDQRLWSLCEAVVGLAGQPDQHLTLCCECVGSVPPELAETVLRVVHEFVGNSVKHGMHMRLIGMIGVCVVADASGTTLEVEDDGWGCGRDPGLGEGLRVARILAEAAGGRISLQRAGDRTLARLALGPVLHG